jgi:hypothetical protein
MVYVPEDMLGGWEKTNKALVSRSSPSPSTANTDTDVDVAGFVFCLLLGDGFVCLQSTENLLSFV